MNAELVRREEPASGFRASRPGLSGANVSDIAAADLEYLQSFLINTYGYDPGPYEGYSFFTSNEKLLAKLDWNINQKHKANIRYNYLNSWKERPYFDAVIPGQTTVPFINSGYRQNEGIHSLVTELNSNLGPKFSNKLIEQRMFPQIQPSLRRWKSISLIRISDSHRYGVRDWGLIWHWVSILLRPWRGSIPST